VAIVIKDGSSRTGFEPTGTAVPHTLEGIPDIQGIVHTISQSVVKVDVTRTVYFGPRPSIAEGAGTGFVYSANGLIGTNAHVVNGAKSIVVTLADGTQHDAQLVGMNQTEDLALVRIEATDLLPIALGISADLEPGQLVITVGNSLALEGGPTASLGIVSALDRMVASETGILYNLIQTDAAINEGDSGGPLVDANGRMIGINTIGATSAQSVGFAITVDKARRILKELAGPEF
jgi:S1-C subfamily serine protease